MAALDLRKLRRTTYQVIETEERGYHLRRLLSKKIGFREEEEFLKRERGKLKGGGKNFDVQKVTIKVAMGEKLKDNYKFEGKLKKQKSKIMGKIADEMGEKSMKYKKTIQDLNRCAKIVRKRAREKFTKKEKFLEGKYGKREKSGIEELKKEDRKKYGGANIFDLNPEWTKKDNKDPSVVCGNGKKLQMSDEEMALLRIGPKFNVMGKLCEERFEVELEQAIMKVKWEIMGNEEKLRKKSESDVNIESILDEEELRECEEYVEMMNAKTRMIFDVEKNVIDFGNRRTTDLKNNARVIFPKTLDFQTEAKLELLRIEAMGLMMEYMREKCDKKGNQVSNLSKKEYVVLKSPLKRTREGEIVVMSTDKSGKLAVMDRECYEQAGLSHVGQDVEVGWDELKGAQREINGHVSMLIKVFRIGKN